MIATVQFVSRLLPQDLGISQFPRGQSSPVSTTFLDLEESEFWTAGSAAG